ncbi:MAG: TonB-dependent receptor, partial [Candidatus Eiseniibacteriota bacterium]
GPVERFAQLLAGAAGEWEDRLGEHWSARLGAGIDVSATPESGDKPRRATLARAALGARLTRQLGGDRQVHLAAGRRARFPSLRELYSGALGRFVPNPDLAPELLTTVELGIGEHRPRLDWALAAYLQRIDDGIVRVALPDRRFQRRNVDAIRARGVELSVQWRPRRGPRIDLQQSLLRARTRGPGGAFDLPVERRPVFLTTLGVAQTLGGGLTASAEAIGTGARYGLDAASGGLIRLPPALVLNLRAAWRLPPHAGRPWGGELYARLDNLLDREVLAQPGLPEPGRVLRVGVRVEL